MQVNRVMTWMVVLAAGLHGAIGAESGNVAESNAVFACELYGKLTGGE